MLIQKIPIVRIMTATALLIISLLGCSEDKITLLTKGPVPVYNTQEDALSGNRSLASGMLREGQHVLVLKCIDVKHYEIYKIRTADGSIKYVNDGNYSLIKN
jgi:hypothetical protein